MPKELAADLILGVGDSDLQVIGERYTLDEEKSEETMWRFFAKTSNKVYKNTTPDEGIDRYHKWQQDIKRLKYLGIRHYRTSISMARTMDRQGRPNKKALDWYIRYFKALKAGGINVYATLYHWELPQYLSAQGGWTNRKTAEVFARHVEIAVEYLSPFVEEFFILNEPWASSMLSYHKGLHAPGEKNLSRSILAAHHLLLGQAMAYEKLRELSSEIKISTVYNVIPAYPHTNTPTDIAAAKLADGYVNRWFLDPLFFGAYPKDMVEMYGDAMPDVPDEDMARIKIGGKLNALGINYYFGDSITADPSAELGYKQVLRKGADSFGIGWPVTIPPVYPSGLFDALEQTYNRYKHAGLKRLYVAENGFAENSPWDGKNDVISDPKRISYFKKHIAQTIDAINAGIPVEKYFAWTMIDNYEWGFGYKPDASFGFFGVDRKTMRRLPKQSALWYRNLNKTRILED